MYIMPGTNHVITIIISWFCVFLEETCKILKVGVHFVQVCPKLQNEAGGPIMNSE